MRLLLVVLAALFWSTTACSRVPDIGQDGHIRAAKASSVLVAAELADLEALFHATDVKDQVGINALIQSGRILNIPNDTAVHVLSAAIGRYQVRLLSGAYARQAVWINWDALIP